MATPWNTQSAGGRAFGGPGNTKYDQLKMSARNAVNQCSRGRCGTMQYNAINSFKEISYERYARNFGKGFVSSVFAGFQVVGGVGQVVLGG